MENEKSSCGCGKYENAKCCMECNHSESCIDYCDECSTEMDIVELGKLADIFTDTSIKDAIGGVHDEGLGWNPSGIFCGECSCVTCEECGISVVTE